jgi:hypothetical protein
MGDLLTNEQKSIANVKKVLKVAFWRVLESVENKL